MSPRLLAQLGWVFEREAERLLPDPYAWPPEPRRRPSRRAAAEARRLRGVADELFARAISAGLEGTGTDYCFGPEGERNPGSAPEEEPEIPPGWEASGE